MQTTDWTSIDAYDGLRELVDAANETATSNPAVSYARWDDDRSRDGYAVLPGASVHRDSDTLARSNSEVIRADIETRFPGALLIEGASHWAVGWVEAVYVPVRAEDGSIHPAALAACAWAAALADYPVADESHFSALEYDEALDTLEKCYSIPADRCGDVLGWLGDNGYDTGPDYMEQRGVDEAVEALAIDLDD